MIYINHKNNRRFDSERERERQRFKELRGLTHVFIGVW